MLRWLFNIRKSDPQPVRLSHPRVKPHLIHPDARMVVQRLHRQGHAAYIVGGAVRDLLLNLHPKDFDVATSAHPGQIRRLFRYSIVIGRRFRLVHVRFGRDKVVEVATFRRHHGQDAGGGPVRDDNVFGTEKEDAFRRDFTLNALFYDPDADQVIDYVGGLNDLKERRIRCIGNPFERLPEDPVRILRAVKFSAKYDLAIDSGLEKAMSRFMDRIRQCSNRRLFEELLKIIRSACLAPFVRKSREVGFLRHFLPFLHKLDARDPDGLMRIAGACDASMKRERFGPPFAFALLLWPEIKRLNRETREPQMAIRSAIQDFCRDYSISRADKFIMRDLLSAKLRLDYYLDRFRQGRPVPFRKLRSLQDASQTLAFYRTAEETDTGDLRGYEFWKNRLGRRPGPPQAEGEAPLTRRPL
jgi:poly(A) polymerase